MKIEIYRGSTDGSLYERSSGCFAGEVAMDSLFAADILFAEVRDVERALRGAAPGCKAGCFVRCVFNDNTDTKKFFRLRVNRALEAVRSYVKRNKKTRWPNTIAKRIKTKPEAW